MGKIYEKIKQTEVEQEPKTLAAYNAENEHLKKQLARVTEQLEILKNQRAYSRKRHKVACLNKKVER